MAIRFDLPKIKPHRDPSIFNEEMVDDAGWGWLVGEFAGIFVGLHSRAANIISLGGIAIGAVIGGQRGKKRMQDEQLHGKTVEDPGLANTEARAGLMIGMTMMDALQLAKKETRFTTIMTGLFLPGIVGSIFGYQRMAHEVKQAEALRDARLNPPPIPQHPPQQTAAAQVNASTAENQGVLQQNALEATR